MLKSIELVEAERELQNFLEEYPEMKSKQKTFEALLSKVPPQYRLETTILLMTRSMIDLQSNLGKLLKEVL